MNKVIFASVLALVISTSICAQVVRTSDRKDSSDPWALTVKSGPKELLTGQVKGIQTISDSDQSAKYVSLLVQVGKQLQQVELAPDWFVEEQDAHIRLMDTVKVLGTSIASEKSQEVVAWMVQLNGDGGPVLTLRKLNGQAYWAKMEAPKAKLASSKESRIADPSNQNTQPVIRSVPTDQISNRGPIIDYGSQWTYGMPNYSINIGNHMTIVVGPNSFTLGPGSPH